MTNYNRGDVVLVDFPFTSGVGSKKRPAVAISSDTYHRSRQEIVIAAITSNTSRILTGDFLIHDLDTTGLPKPSIVTGIIRTMKYSQIIRQLGTLSKNDLNEVDRHLKVILAL